MIEELRFDVSKTPKLQKVNARVHFLKFIAGEFSFLCEICAVFDDIIEVFVIETNMYLHRFYHRLNKGYLFVCQLIFCI